MPHYSEPKPNALDWQSTLSTDIDRVRVSAAALLASEVVGDLKTAIVRDFFEIGYRNGNYSQKVRDTYVANYLGKQSKRARMRLNFSTALDWLAEIVQQKQDLQSVSENLEFLHDALDKVGRQNNRLNTPVRHGNRIATDLIGSPAQLGTIGDILSVGEEIFSPLKSYYADKPEVVMELQHFSDKLEDIAGEVDRVRHRSVLGR